MSPSPAPATTLRWYVVIVLALGNAVAEADRAGAAHRLLHGHSPADVSRGAVAEDSNRD